MDEIKNTAEAEEQKVEATVAQTDNQTAAEPQGETAQAEATDSKAQQPEAAQAEATQETGEQPAEEHKNPANRDEIIARLKEIVYNGGQAERSELEHLKKLYYRYYNAEVAAEREHFVEEGGNEADFVPAPDATEGEFKAQFALIKEMRSKAAEELEKERQANLERKQQIIERIKQLAASPDEADKGYDEVKQLQAEWKTIKQVPAEKATELWKTYQLYVEQFYDQLRLTHEMRAYDFKKNLEAKTRLCEALEKLADVDDVISALHQSQALAQEYRETGPVAKEEREAIRKRFKDALTAVNKRHQDYFAQLKDQEEENLKKKTEICQKVEGISLDELTTHAQWEKATKEVLDLQAEWKTIGFMPRKLNAEVFERFRMACDRFFQAKTAHFKAHREQLSANLAAKNALVEQAEALKESTDWATTANQLVELQKEWKKVGPVAHKYSDTVWKKFNDACNYFFDRKNEATSGKRKEEEANLKLKKAVIADLEKLVAEPEGDKLQQVRDLQERWNGIGHVPFSKKEKVYQRYRALCDQIYDSVRASQPRRRTDNNFRRPAVEKGGTELTRERARLQNLVESKKQEINTYETNLTFFRTTSKSGNSLIADVEKKVERLKADLVELTKKIAAIGEQIKAEEAQKADK